MGYLLLASFVLIAARWWRSRRPEERYMARLSALMAAVIAVQMWWYL